MLSLAVQASMTVVALYTRGDSEADGATITGHLRIPLLVSREHLYRLGRTTFLNLSKRLSDQPNASRVCSLARS